jgi:glycosyltransferase involved in cell wall biosynthesis
MSLSVVIITRNEAQHIQACLDSVAFATEVIVLDSASSDDTVQLALDKGALVHQTADFPGFGEQKNRALDLVSCPWVLNIDADERVSQALAQEILKAIADPASKHPAFDIPRSTYFCGKWIQHCGWTPDRVVRLFRADAARFSDDKVHERLVPKGRNNWDNAEVGHLSVPMLHYSYLSPEDYWRKLKSYSQIWAEQRFALGQKTSVGRAFASALFAFVRSYVFQAGFLDGSMGLAVCVMQAQGTFAKYFTLYCLNQKNHVERFHGLD